MDHIQQIAALALNAAHTSEGRLLVYSEVDDGVVSADLFSQLQGEPVRYRFSSNDLIAAIYRYWQSEEVAKRWATMALVIEGGRFTIDFQYAESIRADEALYERRPRVIRSYFGDAIVDYSSPNAAVVS
ncbi:MAG: hypothetical protein EOO23_05600 [Comamonadaceae bacterium]|nr:MAG: hypothetical protein EOO23_05600 [Comamonadaceae bacterium]